MAHSIYFVYSKLIIDKTTIVYLNPLSYLNRNNLRTGKRLILTSENVFVSVFVSLSIIWQSFLLLHCLLE